MDYPTDDPDVGLVNGKFSDGDPLNGIPASLDRAVDMDAVYDEIIAVIVGAGLTPDEDVLTQLRDAINAKISAAIAGTALVNKLNATVDPTVNDDSGDGYAEGSKWFNLTTDNVFVCLDATVGAAIWKDTTVGLEDLGTAALCDTGTAAAQVPRNSDLGSASLVDTGTAGSQVPTNTQAAGLYAGLSTENNFTAEQRLHDAGLHLQTTVSGRNVHIYVDDATGNLYIRDDAGTALLTLSATGDLTTAGTYQPGSTS